MSGLDQNEGEFVRGIHNATGIDERVLIAWMYQEGAFKKGGTGGFNYLNVAPFPGDNRAGISSGGFSQFSSVQDSIRATSHVLQQKNMNVIVSTARTQPTPQRQIAAIAMSPWDLAHYGGTGGPTLVTTFEALFGGSHSITTPYQGADIVEGFKSDVADFTSIDMHTITGAAGKVIGAAGDIAGPSGIDVAKGIWGGITSIGDAIGWAFSNWDRILLVIGGGIGLLVAIILIFKAQSGERTFTFSRGE